MSIGLGKNYLVKVISYKYGCLDECLAFINELKSTNPFRWFELRPIPKIKKGSRISCVEYQVNYVEDGEL